MKLTSLVVDDFYDDYDRVKAYVHNCNFDDVAGPTDDIIYQDINTDIPIWLQSELKRKLYHFTGVKPSFHYLFTRRSLDGVVAPHQAHTDRNMGEYTFLSYINPAPKDAYAGTDLLRHKETGIETHPQTQEEMELWERDKNEYDNWEVINHTEWRENRALFFRSELYHRAEPLLGFGNDSTDGRIIICAFF